MTKKEYILDFLKEINYAYNHPAMYDDLKRLLDEMEEEILESANCKWISVTERLPEKGELVLVWYEYFRYGNYNRMYQTYGIGYQYNGFWGGDVSGTNARCIAWMPLPEPYKAEGSEEE